MSGDYSRNRTTSSGNRQPVKRNNPKYVSQQDVKRATTRKATSTRIKHTKPKKELSHAPARKKFYFFGHDGNLDMGLFSIVLILLVVGVIMMFSASYFWALDEFNDGYYYLKRQMAFAVGGLILMSWISTVDYHFLQNTKIAYISFALIYGLNLITAVAGVEVAGARRWIVFFGMFSFQPSELLKISFIIVMAYLLAANYPYFKKWRYSLLPCGVMIGLVCLMMAGQRHMSALLIFVALGVLLMFFGGVEKKHMAILVGIFGAGLVLLLGYKMITSTGESAGFGYITTRFKAWQHPESDIRDTTNQIWNSLLAIGSGGVMGVGLGESKQKFLWLSEAQNDFVFAIVCEELGFIGASIVILLFVAFIWRGISVASKAPDRFGMLLSAGITMHIGLQALLNIAVATNTIPNTGISLPFFSYGGTALLMQLCEIGVLLSVSRKTTHDE
ncbi:MAG: cell division protein FtsW [Oscillospiraceae bacterium]|nr:cell division protein FtsW [Oscillospiraceae bacterium]MBQ8378073.1 cell division protein FtsW [Oscillospiraceae bacterium]